MKRTCTKCGIKKDINNFGWNSKSKGWRSNTCLDCYNQYQREKRERHPEQSKKASRNYYSKNKKVILAKMALAKSENKMKVYACRMVENAVKIGRIQKELCAKCGSNETEAHHTDYLQPLDVMWLCRRCHKRLHGKYASKMPYNTV